MSTISVTARQAGVLYLLFSLVAIIGEFGFPTFFVSGSAAASSRNIAENLLAYRLSILTGVVTHVLFIVLVAWLYRLFEAVDRTLSLLMVLFVTVGVALAFANLIFKFGPLVLLGDANFRTAFTETQRDALLQGAFGVRRGGAWVTSIFWGLWLFPFGRLVMKSNFLPSILGVLLMIAGVGYCVSGVTSIILPDLRQMVNRFTMPLYFGEIPIILWLLIAGARERVKGTVAAKVP